MKYFAVYRICCIITNKNYIGYSYNPIGRVNFHERSPYPIGCAIRKYGWENFEVDILFLVRTKEEAQQLEQKEIRNFNSIVPNGYNLTAGGEGGDTFTNNPNKELIRKKLGVFGNKNAKGHHPKKPGTSEAMKKNNPMKRPEVVAKFKGKNNSMFGKKRFDVSARNKNPSITEQIKRLQNKIKKLEKKIEGD